MPTIAVSRDELHRRLGQVYTQQEFEDLCFRFGLELDEVTTAAEEQRTNTGVATTAKSSGIATAAEDEVIYKVEIPANRYDLLCVEGLARGLRVFLGKEAAPRYTKTSPTLTMTITPATAQVRPYGVAAVLRNVKFDERNYASFIDLQDKLHQNICRRRTLVAIGTHDLDTIEGPFTYDAKKPEDIVFKPLRVPAEKYEFKEYSAKEMMTIFKDDLQLKQYLHIIEDKPVYPVIYDSKGRVLSLPPIINGDLSRITLNTKNVFIECTATDKTKANIVLDMVVAMFAEYCAEPFVVEPVKVIYPDGTEVVTPELAYRKDNVRASDIYTRMGIPREEASPATLASLLTKMQLNARLEADDNNIEVEVPPTRPDVLHACDIWEDAAVAYGFNNIPWHVPEVVTTAMQQPMNKLTDQLRNVIAQAGFSEALTFALCSAEDNFGLLRRQDDGKTAAVIANPKTRDFQVCRANLLSGLLKTLNSNASMALPIKLFEISDVVLLDPTSDTGARNERRLAAVQMGKTPGFEVVQGLLDYVMKMLEVPFSEDGLNEHKRGYCLQPSQDPAFFGELGAADIIFRGRRVGVLGVVHPEVLQNYDLKKPVAALELTLHPFL